MTFATEQEAERMAKEALERYVSACNPQTRQDASRAIQKMIGVAMHALALTESGKMETVQ